MTTPVSGIYGRDPMDELLDMWNAWLWLYYSLEAMQCPE